MNPFTMRSKRLPLFISASALLVIFSCTKKTDEFTSEPLSDYVSPQVGKYIVYRLDSTVFTNFGTTKEVHSYQEKHVVDAEITDAAGRKGYRVYRFIRDAAGTNPWAPAGSYFIVPNDKTIEFVENNLRFLRLALPLKQGFSWMGNQFLPSEPYSGLYGFNNDNSMYDWEYTIDSVNTTFKMGATVIPDVIKITGVDNKNNIPDTVDVINGKTAKISDTSKTVFLRGSATETITIDAAKPALPGALKIYNRADKPAKLDTIVIPVKGAKLFDYVNNRWTFGYFDSRGQRKDSVDFNLVPQASRYLFVEKYAKGIGMVYQELTMWEYQFIPDPNKPDNLGYFVGFGVKREMIDHN
jgi:hypothetical protein